jgi:hypothetical protein
MLIAIRTQNTGASTDMRLWLFRPAQLAGNQFLVEFFPNHKPGHVLAGQMPRIFLPNAACKTLTVDLRNRVNNHSSR